MAARAGAAAVQGQVARDQLIPLRQALCEHAHQLGMGPHHAAKGRGGDLDQLRLADSRHTAGVSRARVRE